MKINGEQLRTGLLTSILVATGGFYMSWFLDERQEDLEKDKDKPLMFDEPEQKVRTLQHVDAIQTEDVKVIENDQKHIIEELHQVMDRLDRIEDLNQRTADQAYQTNRRLDTIN